MNEENIYEVKVYENDITTWNRIDSIAGRFTNWETANEVAKIIEQNSEYLTTEVEEKVVQIFDTREEYIQISWDKRAVTTEEKEAEKNLAESALAKLTEEEKQALWL